MKSLKEYREQAIKRLISCWNNNPTEEQIEETIAYIIEQEKNQAPQRSWQHILFSFIATLLLSPILASIVLFLMVSLIMITVLSYTGCGIEKATNWIIDKIWGEKGTGGCDVIHEILFNLNKRFNGD